VDATQVQFQASGLAGQANIHLLRGEKHLATQRLVALLRIFEELPPKSEVALPDGTRPPCAFRWEQLYREAAPPKKPGTASGPPPSPR